MTEADLNRVVAATGHARYRWLTSDENPDVKQREGYRRIVRDLAGGREPSESPVVQSEGGCCNGGIDLASPGSEKVTLQ